METITVSLGQRSYPIHIGSGLLDDTQLLSDGINAKQLLVVSNETVAPLYMEQFVASLPGASAQLILPDGEQYKTIDTFNKIIDELIDRRFHRDAALIALGGGVIGDVTGFAAASYQRGISFIQVPTTLLSQVDSSVGGKTAVNHPRAKNMIGAFYQPLAVFADTGTLATLPARELSAGLAEVIKYGLITDVAFFDWLESEMDALRKLDDAVMTKTIRRCCEIKASIVAEDEREHGRRALLNLGHTFGHGLEAIGAYGRWLHGEAVAIGTSMAARVSQHAGYLTAADCDRIDALLSRAGLPVRADDIDVDEMLAAMQLDKKAGQGGLRVILLDRIGAAEIYQAPPADVLHSIITEHCAS